MAERQNVTPPQLTVHPSPAPPLDAADALAVSDAKGDHHHPRPEILRSAIEVAVVAVARLRTALGPHAGPVRTVPKRGHRLMVSA